MQQTQQVDQLIMLKAGLNSADAALLKSVMEGEGIQAFTSGGDANHFNAPVDLLVKMSDKERAVALLQKVVTMPRCAIPVRRDEDGEEQACKHCGSTRVHPYEGEVPTFIPGIRIEAKKVDNWFHCLQCESHYRDERSRLSGMPIGLLWSAALGAGTIGLYAIIDWLRWL